MGRSKPPRSKGKPLRRSILSEDGKSVELVFDLDEDESPEVLRTRAADAWKLDANELGPLHILKRSVDARHGRVRIRVLVARGEQGLSLVDGPPPIAVGGGAPVLIVGAGPAGLFCAHELARQGIPSILLERGKKVQPRRRDLKGLTKGGVVDSDSNYCFGEGGAGTYSDGKLYTRAHKRGDVRDVIETLVKYGAPENILTDARPHIGSNKLPKVVTAMRESLEDVGVEFRFESRVTRFVRDHKRIVGVQLAAGEEIYGRAVVVATGHSARDVFAMLDEVKAALEPKGFALGVRIEHPQPLINSIQYGRSAGHPKLPAAAYRLVQDVEERGVFSFCMCPGGWIVPASTETGELVVNGMSLSRRDSPYANSGMVVAVEPEDWNALGYEGPLGGVEFQRQVEKAAWQGGEAGLVAPAIRAVDFVEGRLSTELPNTSYVPGVAPADIESIVNAGGIAIAERLRIGLRVFDKKMRGYLHEDAILVGVESRTSAPVRVLRDRDSLESPSLAGLYPCGEGAGYAGGIVSAAMDGMRVARAIATNR